MKAKWRRRRRKPYRGPNRRKVKPIYSGPWTYVGHHMRWTYQGRHGSLQAAFDNEWSLQARLKKLYPNGPAEMFVEPGPFGLWVKW